ncbi:MAG: acyl-CoA thioesterase II [Oceanococcus sp.]
MNAALKDLIEILQLEQLEQHLFRGQSRNLGGKSVFGGQVLGQGLVAASHTVEHIEAHSVHAYFVRPGDMEAPIVYEVERIRDGRSFAVRRVHAIQHGRPIFSMMASFQNPEPGHEHQTQMPDVPMPEELPLESELRQSWLQDCPAPLRPGYQQELAIAFKPVDAVNPFRPEVREPTQHIWFKASGHLPDDMGLHQAVLAYASDFNFLGTAMRPHAMSWFQRNIVAATLDHVIWFHRPARLDDWLLYSMHSPSAQAARGLTQGRIFTREGVLVASLAQESLMRNTQLNADDEIAALS